MWIASSQNRKKVNIFQSLWLFSPEIGMLGELKTKFEKQNEK